MANTLKKFAAVELGTGNTTVVATVSAATTLLISSLNVASFSATDAQLTMWVGPLQTEDNLIASGTVFKPGELENIGRGMVLEAGHSIVAKADKANALSVAVSGVEVK